MSVFDTSGGDDDLQRLLADIPVQKLPLPSNVSSPEKPEVAAIVPRIDEVAHPSGSDFVTIGPRISGGPDDDSEDGAAEEFQAQSPSVPLSLGEAGQDEFLAELARRIQAGDTDLASLLGAPPAEIVQSPEPREISRTDLATQGWRGILARLGFRITKGRAERFEELMARAREVIASDAAEGLVLGVSSFKGGCGKSSTAVTMGRIIAEERGHEVVILDADRQGTLLARATTEVRDEPSPTARGTMKTLAAALKEGESATVRGHARPASGGLFVVPGNELYTSSKLTAAEFADVVAAARGEFRIVLVDMSVVEDGPMYREVLGSLDGLVMVLSPNEDSAGFGYETKQTLIDLDAPKLNQHRITLINHKNPDITTVDTRDLAEGMKLRDKRDVAETMYDRHLAEASTIILDQMSTGTADAFTLATAALLATYGDDRH